MGVGVKIFLCSRLQKGRGKTAKKKKLALAVLSLGCLGWSMLPKEL